MQQSYVKPSVGDGTLWSSERFRVLEGPVLLCIGDHWGKWRATKEQVRVTELIGS